MNLPLAVPIYKFQSTVQYSTVQYSTVQYRTPFVLICIADNVMGSVHFCVLKLFSVGCFKIDSSKKKKKGIITSLFNMPL